MSQGKPPLLCSNKQNEIQESNGDPFPKGMNLYRLGVREDVWCPNNQYAIYRQKSTN